MGLEGVWLCIVVVHGGWGVSCGAKGFKKKIDAGLNQRLGTTGLKDCFTPPIKYKWKTKTNWIFDIYKSVWYYFYGFVTMFLWLVSFLIVKYLF